MASTRNKNSAGNYKLEQNGINNIRDNLLYHNSPNGHANIAAFPELYRASYMPADNLSKNYVDIESNLRGINANNLVNPVSGNIKCEEKKLPMISFFDRETVIMPDNLTIDNNRPFIMG
jgi:hypothetical protein